MKALHLLLISVFAIPAHAELRDLQKARYKKLSTVALCLKASKEFPSHSEGRCYPLTDKAALTLDFASMKRFNSDGRISHGFAPREGVTMVTNKNAGVLAIDSGRVINTGMFLTPACSVDIKAQDGSVIRYGFLQCNHLPKLGTRVLAGDSIGRLGELKRFKSSDKGLLRIETYSGRTTGGLINVSNCTKRRSDLNNPNRLVQNLAQKEFNRDKQILQPTALQAVETLN